VRIGAVQLRAAVEHLVAEAVADVEQDRVFARELVRVHRLALRPLVALRHHDLERLLVEERRDDARRIERQRDDRGVDAAALQRTLEVLGQVLLDVERHLRRKLVQRGNEVRQQVGRDRVDHAEAQRPDQLVATGLRDLLDPRRLLEHALRLLDDALAHRRDRDLALAALEERRAELVLELLDRDRERRLRHEALRRGAPEASFLRDRDDVAQLVQRHDRAASPGKRARLARNAANSRPVSGCLSP